MQQLPGRKDINSRNSVYEQSALDTFYGKTQEEAMELLLENFAHYSEHLGWMSSAGFAYYGQAWEKMLDYYDFESADPEFTHEFSAYAPCYPDSCFWSLLSGSCTLSAERNRAAASPSEKAGGIGEP